MSTPAFIRATVKIRPGTDEKFIAWKAHYDQLIGKFAGFVSCDITPPVQHGGNEWTIILNFRSKEYLLDWQTSPERALIIAEGYPIFEGGTIGEVVQVNEGGVRPDNNVTEVIFSKIKHGMEDNYQEWAARMQAAQAKYPGYKGTFLQPPEENGGFWTTIMRFDSASQLEAWMNAPERKEMLSESKAFVEQEQLTHLATSFPGWVPIDPMTGKGPPNWKTSLLVLLGLFPIVMLEMKFLSPILAALHLHASLATFIGNALSVFLTSFAIMPLFIRWFGWWLFPDKERVATSGKGILILVILFVAEIVFLWKLLLW
jgi:antibiotic biosynthesis monooxygenase (ABM) superfamily enzyme